MTDATIWNEEEIVKTAPAKQRVNMWATKTIAQRVLTNDTKIFMNNKVLNFIPWSSGLTRLANIVLITGNPSCCILCRAPACRKDEKKVQLAISTLQILIHMLNIMNCMITICNNVTLCAITWHIMCNHVTHYVKSCDKCKKWTLDHRNKIHNINCMVIIIRSCDNQTESRNIPKLPITYINVRRQCIICIYIIWWWHHHFDVVSSIYCI